MPQTLTLDQLAAYGAVGTAPPPAAPAITPAPSPGRGGKVAPRAMTLDELAGYGAPDPEANETGLHSFYAGTVEPVVNLVKNALAKAQTPLPEDVAAEIGKQVLGGFGSELKNFAQHPYIRNLPIVGTGATATYNKASKQYDAGNYTGMLGTIAGFLTPFILPEVAPRAFAAAEPGLTAAREAVAGLPTDLGAAARAAAPDAAKGVAQGAVGLGIHKTGLGVLADLAGYEVGLKPALRSLKSAASSGVDAFQASRASRMGLSDEALAAIEAKLTPHERMIRAMQASAADAEAAAARTPPPLPTETVEGTPPLWSTPAGRGAPPPDYAYAEPAAGSPAPADTAPPPVAAAPGRALTLDEVAAYAATPPEPAAVPARTPVLTAPDNLTPQQRMLRAMRESAAQAEPAAAAGTGALIDTAPDAREILGPELAAHVELLQKLNHPEPVAPPQAARAPAAVEPAAPALTPAQKLEDAVHEHRAYLMAQAQDIEWGNRARQADTYADWFIKNKLKPTPENMQRAANELEPPKISKRTGLPLGVAEQPSGETMQMIEDRVDWHRERNAPAAAPPIQLESNARPTAGTAEGTLDKGPTGTRSPIPAPTRAGDSAARPLGDSTDVEIPGEARKYAARYEVRELTDVQPSHIGQTFQPNPQYEYENERNYDDPRNQRKIIDWSAKGPTGFKARNMLNTAPDASIGPPVIDARGNVLGGNGRSMILQRVYESNSEGAAAYRAELDRTAGHYGIDPASYAHMKNPVLVRTLGDVELAPPGSAQRAIGDFNKKGTASLTPAERAIADARGVSQGTLDDIALRMDKIGSDATLSETLEGRDGIEVLRNLERDGVISPQESAELATETALTKAGKDRISGLMLGRFFTNARQLDALPAAIRGKMERIAAPLARLEGSPEYSISTHMRGALDLLEAADAHRAATLDDYISQRGMFDDHQFSPEEIALAKQLQTRGPVNLTQAVRDYAAHAKYADEFQGTGMFGDIPEPVTPAKAFELSFGEKTLEAERKAKADAAAKRAADKRAAESADNR